MGIKKVVDKVKEEVKVLKGEESKDKVYQNEQNYPDMTTARTAFEESKKKLFNVNLWSNLEGINSTFELHDDRGRKTTAEIPEIGYFVKITLPASNVENWVNISSIRIEDNLAEFTVHPSEKPNPPVDEEEVTEHFFTKEASSTFRVELQGTRLIASEIGKNEYINNQGEESGDRSVLNTLIAEGGWAGFQGLQWDKLTSYLVHQEERKDE
ncbi:MULTISPECIES: hypothetical protein [Pontibacter]|uniref:Uncharacterized protein n=1 Tax=Pontibacter lucknowensis TaxID=1077936 RepID=A0A1N7B3E8_9BACT|nr:MULTISPECIES: hypothetical protein [Pontibacter]EJF09197.1 hypothetical protein O71_16521 [Pontibacter sp. BAB1700]SIR45796.1 hypothetical protein SAMN05421545_3760 [Pontibacter lucknowensis]